MRTGKRGLMRKSAVVCGAGGFIASHLVKRLKAEGYWVRGVDIKTPEFSMSAADDFEILDLRELDNCIQALRLHGERPDEVYQLAADMGGMGFIHTAECEIMHGSVDCWRCRKPQMRRYFCSAAPDRIHRLREPGRCPRTANPNRPCR